VPATFYFAIGARPRRRDLDVALAVGQRHFLVPVGSTAIPWLRYLPGVRVALDSAAWPPDNPDRPSLEAYARAILSWRLSDGSWGNLDWAASYDHIGNWVATRRDHARLLALLRSYGASDAPVIASVQYPEDGGAAILGHPEGAGVHQTASVQPHFGIGGLVPLLSPTRPRAVFDEASTWFDSVLAALSTAIAAGVASQTLSLHLFGIGRPGFVVRSPLIVSFDSSGPAQMAMHGWQKIAHRYTPTYGFSAEKLQVSREARLAYWLIHYREAVGLSWESVSENFLHDDRTASPWVQLSLASLLAT
jgi:hypothetical protein